MTPATRALLLALARILRAAAEEAETIAAEASPPLREGEIRTTGRPVREQVKRRTLEALKRAGFAVEDLDPITALAISAGVDGARRVAGSPYRRKRGAPVDIEVTDVDRARAEKVLRKLGLK